MVHGNHISIEHSKIGYEYPCKMLSSQGFIAASIDENILNFVPILSSTNYGRIFQLKKYIASIQIIDWNLLQE